ncbi:hypothetical protein NW762_000479 [Fusarium torreyae]|uniref:Uncharacterized protein n=1 Tax=Fusarium torreyae TaxID=1237075 RepID=A0A9W8VLN7_9HYPO|nr:hypothetical protein NW762_000479 [Fusarium torreyae]
MSAPLEDTIQLLAAIDNGTPRVRQEEQTSTDRSSTSDSSVSQASPEKQPNNGNQLSAAQSCCPFEGWTVSDIMELQNSSHHDFLDDCRFTSSNERSILLNEVQHTLDEQTSSLSRTLQSGLQSGLDQIFTFLRDFTAQPAQGSVSAEIEELKSMLRAEEQHSKNVSARLKDSNQKLDQVTEELRETNAKLHDALYERDQQRQLRYGGTLANSAKTTDDMVLSKWNQLAYNIRCLARILAHDPPTQQLDDTATKRLKSICNSYHKFLKEEDYCESLMQGYLWAIVKDEVFDAGQPVWGEFGSYHFKWIRDLIITRVGQKDHPQNDEPTLAHAARWFAQGSTMITKLWGKDHGIIKDLVNTETKLLKPFFLLHGPRADRADKNVNDQLRDIINRAIEIDRMMMCSKAIFRVLWRDESQKEGPRQRFNEDVMIADVWVEEPTRKSLVNFFVSPIFCKLGTADGQRYDTEMVLVKASVVCD